MRRNEAALRDTVLAALEPHFLVQREVPGTTCDHATRLRIDAVLRPREPERWKNAAVALGVEFKDVLALTGDTRNFTSWLAQCIDYSHTTWDGYGRLPVFVCPSLVAGGFEQDRPILTRVMGQLGIGELRDLDHYGWTFVLHDHHRMWSQLRGVEQGKHWSLAPKAGSR